MALGPLLAVPLAYVPDVTPKFLGINFHIDGIMVAGYTMALVWLLFAVLAWFAFEEPLHRLKQLQEE